MFINPGGDWREERRARFVFIPLYCFPLIRYYLTAEFLLETVSVIGGIRLPVLYSPINGWPHFCYDITPGDLPLLVCLRSWGGWLCALTSAESTLKRTLLFSYFLQETYKLPHRLIEKKRRDRINECIAQLKDLLPEHLKLTVSPRGVAGRDDGIHSLHRGTCTTEWLFGVITPSVRQQWRMCLLSRFSFF